MKSLLIYAAVMAAFCASAQKGWQIGFEVAPGYYTMLNDMDKNADPEIISFDNPEIFSAPRTWAFGAKAFYGFTNSIGIQTGLRYSWGRQDYTYGDRKEGTVSTELNYLQVPMLFSWNGENKSGLRFYASLGVAPAWLFTYYENNTDDTKTSITSYTSIINHNYVRSFYNYSIDMNGDVLESQSANDWKGFEDSKLYNSFNLFFVAETGFIVPLNNGLSFNVAFNYYQSLINPDNISSFRWDEDKYTRNENPYHGPQIDEKTKYDRPKTTLMTIGLSLGLLYELDW